MNRVPLIKYWHPSMSMTGRLRAFVLSQQPYDFYEEIGFPNKIEFHFLPTWQDWKRALSAPVRWFFYL